MKHTRLAIRVVAALSFVVAFVFVTTPPTIDPTDFFDPQRVNVVSCRSWVARGDDTPIGLITAEHDGSAPISADRLEEINSPLRGTDSGTPHQELDARAEGVCEEARQPLDRGAFAFLLLGAALLPWALFADQRGRFRRQAHEVEEPARAS